MLAYRNPSPTTSTSMFSHTSGQSAPQPSPVFDRESREGREARRSAREMGLQQQDNTESGISAFPVASWLSQLSQESHSQNVEDTSPHTSVSQEVINANINGSAKSRNDMQSAQYRTASQPGRGSDHDVLHAGSTPRTRSVPSSPRHDTSTPSQKSASKTFSLHRPRSSPASQQQHSVPDWQAPPNQFQDLPFTVNEAVVHKTSTAHWQQAAVTGRPESKQALISGTPPAPSILRYSVAKQKSTNFVEVRRPVSTYEAVGPPQSPSPPIRAEQKISFAVPTPSQPDTEENSSSCDTSQPPWVATTLTSTDVAPSMRSPCHHSETSETSCSSSEEDTPTSQVKASSSTSCINMSIQLCSPGKIIRQDPCEVSQGGNNPTGLAHGSPGLAHGSPGLAHGSPRRAYSPAHKSPSPTREANVQRGMQYCVPLDNHGAPTWADGRIGFQTSPKENYPRSCRVLSPSGNLSNGGTGSKNMSPSPRHPQPPAPSVTSPLPAPSVSYSAYQQVLEENQRLCDIVAEKDCELQRLHRENTFRYERLADQLKTTNGKLTSKCQEFWATRNQLEKTKDQLALCEGRLVSAHNELSGCREELESSRMNRKSHDSAASCEIQRLTNQLAQVSSRRRDMDNVLTTCKSELKMAENSVQRLTAERETLTREKTRLSQELQDLKYEKSKYEERCQGYEANYRGLEQKHQAMRSQCDSLQAELVGYRRKEQRQKDDSSGEMSHLQDRVSNLEKQNADLINNLASANKIANEERVRAEREAEKAEIERVKCGEIRDRSSQERVLMDADRRRLEKFERTNRDLLTEKQKVDQTNVQLQEQLKELTEKYTSLENDFSAMRKQISDVGLGLNDSAEKSEPSSSLTATPCTECAATNRVTVEDLKFIIETFSERDSDDSGTSCRECIRKDAEFRRLEERLTGLYNKGSSSKVTGNPADDECDFLRHENDRLHSELENVLEELKTLKSGLPGRSDEEKDAELESVKKENDRLNKELQKSMAEVNQLKSGGGNLTNYLTEQLESLREENRRLSSQLKEAIDELAEHKKASQPCLKSASDTVAKGSKPLLPPNPVGSAAFVPSAPDVTATPNQQTQDYAKLAVREANLVTQVSELEAKVVELNQKLSDLNVAKGKELGDLNRLIDECADDKLQTARRDKSVINEKNEEIKKLKNEIRQLKDTSVLSDYQTCREENSKLRQQADQLQHEFDLLKLSASEAQKTAADVAKLNDQISRLEEELSFLKERDEVADGEETKDSQISSLRYELQLAKKDIESYHNGQPPTGSTAYIVRMRDETIKRLHEKIGDLERRNQKMSTTPPRSRTTTPGKSRHREDKSDMLVILTDESARMKENLEKLEADNVKLIQLVKQRDGKIFELKDEVEWLKKGKSQEQLITTYTRKLKQGEQEMGQLHQSMEMLTKQHSALLLAKEHEILDVRTDYAKQLSLLINDFTNRNNFQEGEMRKLCKDIDHLERRNQELERVLRDYQVLKSEQLPKMRADLESLRKTKADLRSEFDRCNIQLKDTLRMVSLLEKEKVDAAKMHSTAVANKQEEVDMLQAQLELHESNKQTAIRQRDAENQKLKAEISELMAGVQERDGAVAHWKLKHEDTNRQIADVEERHALIIKAKNTEINTLVGQIEELSKQVDTASSVNDAELFRLQSQLKELQRQHSDILEQNHSTIKLKEEEMKRLYSEIGDMSAHLHAVNKDKDAEIQRLRNESSLLKEEKKDMLSDNQTLMQEKQTEIRKLMVDIEKMEVDAAKMRATNEQALSDVKAEYQLQMEQFSTDRAHLIAVKDNEIQNLRQEIDKLIGEAKDGGSSIAEMKKTIFQLEQDKAELLLLKEQWQADMDKIFSEYEVCKSDKDDFEGMVDRLSREMEDRVEGLKAQHIEELTTKDNLIRELYTKVEKIAKDRGEMSSHLHDVLQQKEQKIEELFKKLHEYDQCLDEAEQVFRSKLQKKAQEVKWLREEIRKMGEEGIRLLDMREREIGDMRDHLKTMLKVMEQRIKSRSSSHFVITRPQSMKPSEPHLKPSARSSKSLPKKTSRGSRTSSFFSSPSKKSSRQ